MRFLISITIALFCLTSTTFASATTVDVAASFPSYQGENGFWAQAYSPSAGTFRMLSDLTSILPKFFGTPEQSVNMPSARGTVDGARFLPAYQQPVYGTEWAVLTFTAPVTGKYHLVGTFFNGNPTGATTRGVVFVNNSAASPLFSGNVTLTQSAPFDLAGVQLNQGEYLRFAVDSLIGDAYDNTYLTAQVMYPEPGSLLAFASGLIGFAALGRRRIRK